MLCSQDGIRSLVSKSAYQAPSGVPMELVTLTYRKTFLSGNCKGITVLCTIPRLPFDRASQLYQHIRLNPLNKDALTGAEVIQTPVSIL